MKQILKNVETLIRLTANELNLGSHVGKRMGPRIGKTGGPSLRKMSPAGNRPRTETTVTYFDWHISPPIKFFLSHHEESYKIPSNNLSGHGPGFGSGKLKKTL